MLPTTPQFEAARRILRALRHAGHEAYLAGGCVRDLLLGHEPKDYDVATSATPDIVLQLFPHTYDVGAHFGVVLVADRQGNSDDTRILTEVATFRADGDYSDGRRPDHVHYTSHAEEDVQRRDFTLNGLLLDPDRIVPGASSLCNAVIDYVGGLADLDAGILRAIGNPAQRFSEDRLRLLRAIRFLTRFNLTPDPATYAALCAHSQQIRTVSRERVRDELTKMLTEGYARPAFELLAGTGLLAHVLPEIACMQGVEQSPNHHPEGDVFEHTLCMLAQLPSGCPLTLAWGALLHDVGKPSTFERTDRIHFKRHVEVGVAIATDICRRFRFSNAETNQVLALIQNHMHFLDAKKMKPATLKRFFRLEQFEQHLALHRMDSLAGYGNLEHWNFVREQYAAIPLEAIRPTPLITGNDLIAAGYHPGPHFKEVLSAVEDAQLESLIQTKEQALLLAQQEFHKVAENFSTLREVEKSK